MSEENFGVVRFEYNASVRKWRYLILMIGFCFCGAVFFYQRGHFDAVVFGGIIGFVVVVSVISEGALRRVQRQAVEIDFDNCMVRLEYFVYPESFYDIKRKPLVLIPFNEILTVRCVSRSDSLWENIYVDTRDSRFVFQDYFNDYDRLMVYLRQIASETESSPLRRHPMWLGIVAGLIAFGIVGFLGYLLGWI